MTRPFPDVPGVGVSHRFVEARGLRFHVAEAGSPDAPPLLLVHGWPEHWFTWRKVLPALAEHYHCVMPDLRGMGWSDAPPKGYEKESLADDILAVLDVLGLDRVKVLAHDWGGWASYLIALREPARIERLVTLNIPPPWATDPSLPRAAMGLWRLWYMVALASPLAPFALGDERRLAKGIRRDNVQADAFSDADMAVFTSALAERGRRHATVQIYRSFLLRELPGLIRGRYDDVPLTVPTLFLYGERDAVVSSRQVDNAVRPGDPLEVVRVPDSGHFIADEKPGLVAERALAFFAAAG